LHRDEQGAIMLLGVFMAIFLTAMVWYVVGIGDALLYRERMQDAADAAAFSAAVTHARGMNLLVLINMVMAALLAVLVALKLIEAILLAAVVLISVLGLFMPSLWSFVSPLKAMRTGVAE